MAQGFLISCAAVEEPSVSVASLGKKSPRLLVSEVASETAFVDQSWLELLLDDLQLLVLATLLLHVPLLQGVEQMSQMLLVLLELLRVWRFGAGGYLTCHLLQLGINLLVVGVSIKHELVLVREHYRVRCVAREHWHHVLLVRRRGRGRLSNQRGCIAVPRLGRVGHNVRVARELVCLMMLSFWIPS